MNRNTINMQARQPIKWAVQTAAEIVAVIWVATWVVNLAVRAI